MKLDGKKVIAPRRAGRRAGPRDRHVRRVGGAEDLRRDGVLRLNGRRGHGPGEPGPHKGLVDTHGADDLVVVLGAADLESLEVAAETVTMGDPAYVGSLAGVQLGAPVIHILEEDGQGARRRLRRAGRAARDDAGRRAGAGRCEEVPRALI